MRAQKAATVHLNFDGLILIVHFVLELELEVNWLDHTRDILNFVENYLPSGAYDPSARPPPLHLPGVPSKVASSRVQDGLADRNLVGLGHSFGATTL